MNTRQNIAAVLNTRQNIAARPDFVRFSQCGLYGYVRTSVGSLRPIKVIGY